MGPGTFEAKFIPLSKSSYINEIYVIRKSKGPDINKLHYIIIPSIFRNKILGILIRPLYLLIYAIKTEADIVLAYHFIPHSFFAFFTALLTGKKLIIAQTGLYIQNKVENKNFNRLVKIILNKSDYLFVPGSKSYTFWKSMGVNKNRIKILHSTIDTNYYKPDNKFIKEYDFIILSRLVDEKRVDIIIDILYKLKLDGFNFRAVIVGNGKKYNDLIELVSKYNLNNEIDFVGFQIDTNNWFNKAKYYLMYSYSEGLPTSLMQAMSCGLVPVTTDVGNIPDLVTNENGFIYSFNEQEKYLSKLKTLLIDFDDEKYIEYSQNCRNIVIENHSFNSAIKKWDIIFNEIVL